MKREREWRWDTKRGCVRQHVCACVSLRNAETGMCVCVRERESTLKHTGAQTQTESNLFHCRTGGRRITPILDSSSMRPGVSTSLLAQSNCASVHVCVCEFSCFCVKMCHWMLKRRCIKQCCTGW